MSTREDQIRSLVTQEAADWFVANREGLAAGDADRFAAWLKASPMNVQEYLQIAVTAREMRRAGPDPGHSIDELIARARAEDSVAAQTPASRIGTWARPAPVRGWRWAGACAAALVVVSCGAILWYYLHAGGAPAAAGGTVLHFETRRGEQLRARLPDQTVLHLNTDTALEVRYSPGERRVFIRHGQADFEVVHNPQRPFRVSAGPAEVVDLGTNFDVYLQSEATVVTVLEGKVGVGLSDARSPAAPLVQVGANQQLRVSRDAWPAAPATVDAQQATAWLRREIVFDHEPLEKVAAEFNRYSPKPIEIGTPALKGLRISGAFDTDDPNAFIAFLRSLKGVRVEETPTQIRVLQP